MIILKKSGQICKRCHEFNKKFIICESCKKKLCFKCSHNEHYCIECFQTLKKEDTISDYFEDKYKVET